MTKAKKPASQKREKSKEPPLDPTLIKQKMRAADAKRFDESFASYQSRPLPLNLQLKSDGPRKWSIKYQGDCQDQYAAQLRMHAAFGSMSQPFMDIIMGELMTIWEANGGISEKGYNAAIAVIEAAKPQNELEAMLVVQMIAANEAALRATAMVAKCDWFPQSMGFGNLANKFMRTFTAQTEALAKLRRGGEQVVKYVHVHEGGQAVVAGTINQNGGRKDLESSEQPYGAATPQECSALLSSNPTGN